MEIKESIESDIPILAEHLREADLREIQANSGRLPHQAVLNGFKKSKPHAYTMLETFPTESKDRDVDYIAKRMREADRLEVQATGSGSPHEALKDCMDDSRPHSFTCMTRGIPFAMFGVVPFEDTPTIGAIWLLGTDRLTDGVPIAFLRWSKRFLPTLLEPYDMVGNVVDKRNEVHIKWIRWLGFSFIREIIYGPENRPFLEFAKVNHV